MKPQWPKGRAEGVTKKRAEKYDPPLVVNLDFDAAIDALLKVKPPKDSEHSPKSPRKKRTK